MDRMIRIIALLGLFCAPLAAQDWTNTHSTAAGDVNQSAGMATMNGFTHVAGSAYGQSGSWDIIVQRIDVSGNTVWSQTYDSGGDEQAVAVLADAASNTYVAGTMWNATASAWTAVVIAYDPSGAMLWSDTYPGPVGVGNTAIGAVLTSDGKIALLTESEGASGIVSAVVTTVSAADGSVQWTETYDGAAQLGFSPRAIDASSAGIAVAGSEATAAGMDGGVLIYSNTGTLSGSARYDAGSGNDGVFSAVSINAGGIISAGGWERAGAGDAVFVAAQFGATGSMRWDYTFVTGAPGMHRAIAVHTDAANNAVVTGRAVSGSTASTMMTLKLDGTGAVLWSDSFAGGATQPDGEAPLFRGAASAVLSGQTGVRLVWFPALDDFSYSDEIRYRVFTSLTPGGQNFLLPGVEVSGALGAELTGLLPGTTVYAVVRAVDAAGNSDANTNEIVITVPGLDLAVATTTLPSAQAGTQYSATLSATGGTTPYTWSLVSGALPGGLQLNADGSIEGLASAVGMFSFRVKVTDAVNAEAEADLSIEVVPSGLAIDTSPLPDGMAGVVYAATLTATGGTAPYTWSLVSGALPGGVQLSAAGAIAGTPGAAGTFDFRVKVMDALSAEAEADFSIEIAPAGLRIETAALPAVIIGSAYAEVLVASGGVPPYTWAVTSGSLPDGILLSAAGALTGMSNAAGSYQFEVTATDALSATASKDLTLQVTASGALIVTANMSLPGGTHYYTSVNVMAGATLTFSGPATVCVTDTLLIDGAIVADCHALTFTCFQYLIQHGSIDNRCTSGSAPGDLTIIGHHASMDISGGMPGAGLSSSGQLSITEDSTFQDWEFTVPPNARSSTPMAPVASLTADILNTAAYDGDPATVRFYASGADPDGGPVTFDINFGDGEVITNVSPEDGSATMFTKQYTSWAPYTVTLTVKDDDGGSAQSVAKIFVGDTLIDDSFGLGLALDADLLVPVDDTLFLSALTGAGAGIEIASASWDFGDGNMSTDENPNHIYTSPGRYDISATLTDDSANTATATMSVYAYRPDTSSFTGGGQQAAPSSHRDPLLIGVPVDVPRGVRFSSPNTAMIFVAGASVTLADPPAAGDGQHGKGGGTLDIWAQDSIQFNGTPIAGANGANGGNNDPNRNNGGNGGNGGNVNIRAGKRITFNGGTITAGNGGDGASVSVTVPAPGTAIATGRNGGDAGTIHISAGREIIFTAPTTINCGNGGDGGNGTAIGGRGQDKCATGGNGGSGIARGGKGGRADKRGIVRGNVTGTVFVTVNPGDAGWGGDADATGGGGGDALGCVALARGGKGGNATATGGDGGKGGYSGFPFALGGLFTSGSGGTATSTAGTGGTGQAIPDPAVGAPGCPGQDGGDATGTGGAGGNSTAKGGKEGKLNGIGFPWGDGNATANGSNGGIGSAAGGIGGAGTTCNCSGGMGGDATANGGLHGTVRAKAGKSGTATENEGDDGNSNATAGMGGEGGICCTPPGPSGGPGGPGGDATAISPMKGSTAVANGGNGGKGGDGFGPGGGGAGGAAVAQAEFPDPDPGNPGPPGALCVIPIIPWWCGLADIPDGPIAEGPVTLTLYNAQDNIPANAVGTVRAVIQGNITKTPQGILLQPGAIFGLDWTQVQISGPPPKTYPDILMESCEATVIHGTDFPNCFFLKGIKAAVEIASAQTSNPGGLGSEETVSITTTQYFDQTAMNVTAETTIKTWGIKVMQKP